MTDDAIGVTVDKLRDHVQKLLSELKYTILVNGNLWREVNENRTICVTAVILTRSPRMHSESRPWLSELWVRRLFPRRSSSQNDHASFPDVRQSSTDQLVDTKAMPDSL